MGLISWMVVGLTAGLLAKWIVPGSGPGGLIIAIIVGMAGASIGGAIVGLMVGTGATGFNALSVLVATLGAVVLLFLYDLIARRSV